MTAIASNSSNDVGDGGSTISDAMIEANGLCKYYGSFIAAEDISFRVPRGEIVAFLGPNGAGKHDNEDAHWVSCPFCRASDACWV